MTLRSTCIGLSLLALAASGAPLAQAQTSPSSGLRLAALGDLAPYKTIAADTLGLAEKGDIAGAQKRGTDLETAWDDAEDRLKPTDPTRWRVVDKAIDRVLAELRAAQPEQAKITAALKDLVGTMNKGGAA